MSGFYHILQCRASGGAGGGGEIQPLHGGDLRGTQHGCRGERLQDQGFHHKEQSGASYLYREPDGRKEHHRHHLRQGDQRP